MKRIGVLTSGGDAPGMNAAIRAVVRSALNNEMSVIGFKRGYNGLLMQSDEQSDDFQIMTSRSVSDKIHRGGTFLMTARCQEFHDEKRQDEAIENLSSLGVEGLVCIGGDGTFAGANALNAKGFPVIGIPGTIDNDMAYTDLTIGFDTAVNTACELINRIRETSDSHERASLVTVMGRHCGDIAVYTALACGAEIVMTPEIPWTIEEIVKKVRWGVTKGKHSMIMIFAEGAFSSLKSNIAELCAKDSRLADLPQNRMTASEISNIIEVLSGHETRATVLGYTQRGGSPSSNDRVLASRFGARAVKLLHDDKGGRAVGIRKNQIIDVPIADALGNTPPPETELYNLIQQLS